MKQKETYFTKGKKLRRLNTKATAKFDNSRNTYIHFGNDGGRYYMYLDGAVVDAKNIQDFHLETMKYSASYLEKLNSMTKLQRIIKIIRS